MSTLVVAMTCTSSLAWRSARVFAYLNIGDANMSLMKTTTLMFICHEHNDLSLHAVVIRSKQCFCMITYINPFALKPMFNEKEDLTIPPPSGKREEEANLLCIALRMLKIKEKRQSLCLLLMQNITVA